MSTDTEIRTTLRQVAEATDAPTIDRVGFERRVRWRRHRRRAGLAGATAAVAAVVLAVPLAVSDIGFGPDTGPATGGVSAPNPPAYFAAGSRLMMLDRAGTVREVDFQADGIVGPTARGVLVHGMDGRLAHLRVEPDGDVERLELPALGGVFLALVSSDGTRLATIAWDDRTLVVYDLASGEEVDRVPGMDELSVFDFSDRLLYRDDGALWLRSGDDAVRLPIPDGSASVGGDVVSVAGFDNETTRLYDVSDGLADEVDRVPGRTGDVSPGGRYYAAGVEDEGSPLQLWERATGDLRPFTGVTGDAEQVRWLDADTALAVVATEHDDEPVKLLECEASTLRCVQVYTADSDIQLGH